MLSFQGSRYFVRVSAYNMKGWGPALASTPASAAPSSKSPIRPVVAQSSASTRSGHLGLLLAMKGLDFGRGGASGAGGGGGRVKAFVLGGRARAVFWKRPGSLSLSLFFSEAVRHPPAARANLDVACLCFPFGPTAGNICMSAL